MSQLIQATHRRYNRKDRHKLWYDKSNALRGTQKVRGCNLLKLRQYICKHSYEFIAKHGSTQQNLWKCKKCSVYVIQHYGIVLSYKCKVSNIDGWVYEDHKVRG